MRVEVYKSPCPKCQGTLAPEHIPGEDLYHWAYCVNCGKRVRWLRERVERTRSAES
jgi:endogenous inhibitor of DNA gyrase (YacG/DUF329 family)